MDQSFPEELRYSETHEFVSVEGKIATIGVTDYAVEQLGDIVYIELPKVGDAFTTGDNFGVIESVKAVSDLYIPISGKVVEVNETLSEKPELLNEDPYERGWMLKIELDEAHEVEDLMISKDYTNFVSTL